jgi:predicted NBD/HSP70 family sugar kinase
MLHAGLDLSGKKIDVCLLSGDGEIVTSSACPYRRSSMETLGEL